jgi:DNA polymerase-1
MIVLIDGDTPAYAAASITEELDEASAVWEVNKSIERLLADTNASAYKLYLTGGNNFRYSIFPEYKANRLKTVRPRHLQAVKDSLVRNWDAIVSDGCEADDLLSIEQISYIKYGQEESLIVSIDKDLDQVIGWHYHPGIKRKGEWIREPLRYVISPKQARHFFYYQLLVGDSADGIKGAVGVGPKKAEKILDGCETEKDYYEACLNHFSCEEELIQNARCLYLWQKENDQWNPPVERSEET